jgi:choline kinase
MNALILAAGRGQRLGTRGWAGPKCLLKLGGRTLLARHIDALTSCGVQHVRVVVGYRSEDILAELDAISPAVPVDVVFNEEFVRGPLVSLNVGLRRSSDEEDLLIMDADVLYPHALLARLVDSAHLPCVLLDTASKPTGEEMMVGVRAGKARCFLRSIDPQHWDLVGETVGFLKVGASDVATLRAAVSDAIHAGGKDQEYERAYDRLMASSPFGFELVDELPWMEIDFPADITRAAKEILPRIERLDPRAAPAWASVS